MNFEVVQNVDTTYLDQRLLDQDGFCKVLSFTELQAIPSLDFRVWCAKHAIYQYPTLELIDFLQKEIEGQKAIEIGCGTGNIGRHLRGVIMTDSGQQLRPDVRLYYVSLGQAVCEPHKDTLIMDGNTAVKEFKPDVVIGCWVTHRFEAGMQTGNTHGVAEKEIVASAKYIHVGNDDVHAEKPVLQLPHQKLYAPWIVSRAKKPLLNRIAIWEKGAMCED